MVPMAAYMGERGSMGAACVKNCWIRSRATAFRCSGMATVVGKADDEEAEDMP